MLKCREIAHSASEYIDRETSRSRRLAIAFHLLMCGHCKHFVQQMRLAVRAAEKRRPAALDRNQAEAISALAIHASSVTDD